MKEITTIEDWQALINSSAEQPVFLLKHSTTCPISAEAFGEFEAFVEDHKDTSYTFALVKVIESRPVSNAIAEEIQLKHESPQAVLLENKEVKWNASHWNITKRKLADALS
ncbi:bacillithiol system redox-active protein YtxJ [Bacillus sp. FJAT-45037]|uniref:bacillithiol system redox-active protein YtxJ n=1 Tax=Bacillus sp. FJAT-45037 TaxID=2011007 RepID=UPI001E629DC9|nr:bacillithiol system redox-active protein YtxJ [Bacillus sp. FJAT-45037]